MCIEHLACFLNTLQIADMEIKSTKLGFFEDGLHAIYVQATIEQFNKNN